MEGRREDAPTGPDVAVIVVSHNTRDLTLAALESLSLAGPVRVEVWVVDNASTDGSVEAIRTLHPEVKLLALKENVGFGQANNAAMSKARGRAFLLLNSDAELTADGDLAGMLAYLDDHPHMGIVGPRLENAEGRLEYSARRFSTLFREAARRFGLYRFVGRRRAGLWLLGDFFNHADAVDADWVSGACMLVRRSVFEDTGGFDPAIFMYGEEHEWCIRVRKKGWTVGFFPQVTVLHHRAASSGDSDAARRWRIQAAQRADLAILRRHRSGFYAAAFWVVRAFGLLFEWVLFWMWSAVTGHTYPGARARAAGEELLGWMRRGTRDMDVR